MFFEERVSIEFDVICVQIKTCKCINEFQVGGGGPGAGSVQCWPDHEDELGDEICSPRKIGAYSNSMWLTWKDTKVLQKIQHL